MSPGLILGLTWSRKMNGVHVRALKLCSLDGGTTECLPFLLLLAFMTDDKTDLFCPWFSLCFMVLVFVFPICFSWLWPLCRVAGREGEEEIAASACGPRASWPSTWLACCWGADLRPSLRGQGEAAFLETPRDPVDDAAAQEGRASCWTPEQLEGEARSVRK